MGADAVFFERSTVGLSPCGFFSINRRRVSPWNVGELLIFWWAFVITIIKLYISIQIFLSLYNIFAQLSTGHCIFSFTHTHHGLIGKEKSSVALASFLVRTTSTSCHPAAGRRPSNKKPSTSIIPNALPGVYATSSLIHLQKPSRTCPHSSTPASHPDNQPVLGPLQTRKQSVTERKASTTCHPHPSTHEYILSQDTSINIVVGVAFPSRIQHRVGTLLLLVYS